MIEIVRVTPDDWAEVRDIRLAALQDTPDWFWATYEEEKDKPESWWRDFIGPGGWFVARETGGTVGIAAGVPHYRPRPKARALISMWVAPGSRGRGIGRKLIAAVADWARADGATVLELEVTTNNEVATGVYERFGFRFTGNTEPLPRKPLIIEREMMLEL